MFNPVINVTNGYFLLNSMRITQIFSLSKPAVRSIIIMNPASHPTCVFPALNAQHLLPFPGGNGFFRSEINEWLIMGNGGHRHETYSWGLSADVQFIKLRQGRLLLVM